MAEISFLHENDGGAMADNKPLDFIGSFATYEPSNVGVSAGFPYRIRRQCHAATGGRNA
jgi:hypothetical protein